MVRLLSKFGAYERRTEKYLDVIRKFLGNTSRMIVADIGCGSGIFSKALSKDNFVVALDLDRKPLEAIKDVVFVVNADAHHLPFQAESLNLVLSLSLMEHLKDPMRHVNDLGKVVKRGGWLIMQLPNLQYFFEPHSKFPLMFLLPDKIQRAIFRKLAYAYVNMGVTIKWALEILSEAGFRLRKVEKVYHTGVMRLIPWAPSYLFLLQKMS